MEIRILAGSPLIPGTVRHRETIFSAPEEKERAIRALLSAIEGLGLADDRKELFRWRLCLDEVIQNSIEHGNRGDASKTIEIVLFVADETWGVVTTDQGNGFDVSDVPDVHGPEALLREDGRGLLILSEYMDSLTYYDGGRTAFLAKNRRGGGESGKS